MNYTIAIVDDHPLFREGFRSILSLSTGYDRILQFSDGQEILRHLEEGNFVDLIFMDILMPQTDGVAATIVIKKKYPKIKIIAFSSVENIEYIEDMIKAGVDGYILKDASPKDLLIATETVFKGESYFSPKVIIKLSKQVMNEIGDYRTTSTLLSIRELELLKLFCAGFSRKNISNRLFIAERTVDKHKENILKKTNCKNIMELIFYSLKHNLIDRNLLDYMAS